MCLNSERPYRRARGAPETCLQSQSPIAEVLASRVFHLNPNAIASTVFDPSSQLQVTTTWHSQVDQLAFWLLDCNSFTTCLTLGTEEAICSACARTELDLISPVRVFICL